MITPESFTEQLLFTTVRIEVKLKDGEAGVGTGFFFIAKVDEQRSLPLIITNKHVIERAEIGLFQVHEAKVNGRQSQPSGHFLTVKIDNFKSYWIPHPDPSIDLCAIPFQPLQEAAVRQGKMIFYKAFTEEHVWTDQQLMELNAVEDILMAGYPIGLWDMNNNLPLIRRGITASHPAVDFLGKPQFVIDAACFPGSSGSPVVLANLGSYYRKDGTLIVGTRFVLLGVLYAGPRWTAKGEVKFEPIPTNVMPVIKLPLMIHLGYVVKAREVLRLAQYIIKLRNGEVLAPDSS